MRTREEQISELRTQIFNADCFTSLSKAEEKAETYILEAERRAEQHVRAEIGRDSERLDWLESGQSVVLQDADDGWRVTIGGIEFACMEETAREAIDVAREVG